MKIYSRSFFYRAHGDFRPRRGRPPSCIGLMRMVSSKRRKQNPFRDRAIPHGDTEAAGETAARTTGNVHERSNLS